MASVEDRSLSSLLGRLLLAAAAIHIVLVAYIAATHCHFSVDDMISLYFLHTKGLGAFVTMPLSVQMVPLHRLSMWLLDSIVGFHYEGAVLALLLVHGAGVFLLHRVLSRLMGPGILPAALVLVYASYPFVGIQFLWFAAGLQRLPYALAAFFAFDRWLDFREDGKRRRLVGIAIAIAVAQGFYAKGFLISTYLMALELCLWQRTDAGKRRRHLGTLSGLLLFGLALGLLTPLTVGGDATILNTEVMQHLMIQWSAWKVFSKAFFGNVQPPTGFDSAALFATLMWLVLVVFTVLRNRFCLWIWLIAAGCIVGNIGLLALSVRGARMGTMVAGGHRYYLDQLVVLLPLVGVALAAARATEIRSRAVAIGLCAATMGVGVVNHVAFSRQLAHNETFNKTRQFVDNFEGDLARIQATLPPEQQVFQHETMPRHMYGLGFMVYRNLQQMTLAMGLQLRFSQNGRLLIEDDGHIVPKGDDYDRRARTKARLPPKRPFADRAGQAAKRAASPQ